MSTILVVDDDDNNRLVTVMNVNRLGHQAMAASSGDEAIAICGREDIDAVLMDVQMPEMTGYQAAREIRARLLRANRLPPPIIGLSARVMPGDREAALTAGLDEYLTKPVRREELKATLGRFLFSHTLSSWGVLDPSQERR